MVYEETGLDVHFFSLFTIREGGDFVNSLFFADELLVYNGERNSQKIACLTVPMTSEIAKNKLIDPNILSNPNLIQLIYLFYNQVNHIRFITENSVYTVLIQKVEGWIIKRGYINVAFLGVKLNHLIDELNLV